MLLEFIVGFSEINHDLRYLGDVLFHNTTAGILCHDYLTHWGRVTHICVDTNTNIGSDNGLSPGRRQAIIWTNAGILLIRTLEQTSVKS